MEVISPSESARIVRAKVTAYLDAGTKADWTGYPDSQSIDVHLKIGQRQQAQMFGLTEWLGGGEALLDFMPGFSISVAEIF